MNENVIVAENVSPNKPSIESNKLFNLKKLINLNIGKLSDASTFCSVSPKKSSDLKNISHSKNISTKKNNSKDDYSQSYNILTLMKKNPPNLPGVYCHDYNLENVKNNLINKTYGEIYQGTVPNIFLGHFMCRKNRPAKKSCMTQRHKKKLVTIIYYTP